MENLESLRESVVPWMKDELSKVSTENPEVLVEEEAIGTLIVIIICAIFSITLLFIMAIFIDCRHQKLAKKKGTVPKKVLRIKIPKVIGITVSSGEDTETFADKMQEQEPSSSTASAIV